MLHTISFTQNHYNRNNIEGYVFVSKTYERARKRNQAVTSIGTINSAYTYVATQNQTIISPNFSDKSHFRGQNLPSHQYETNFIGQNLLSYQYETHIRGQILPSYQYKTHIRGQNLPSYQYNEHIRTQILLSYQHNIYFSSLIQLSYIKLNNIFINN